MIKKFVLFAFLLLYIYTLTFDIFLNQYFRVPTVLLFCYPLIILFGEIRNTPFLYGRELLIIFIACFIYSIVGNGDLKDFVVNFIIIASCCLFFNYFIADNRKRFNLSVFIFFSLLFLSGVVLLMNQFSGSAIDTLRSKLIGAPINQSPSGIAASIFTFGYQMAAFTGFIFIYSLKHRWNLLVKILVLVVCLALIYLGMQRSVIVTFVGSTLLFLILYYRSRTVYILGLAAIAGAIISTRVDLENATSGAQDNVFAKNERNAERGENRSGLVVENLKIYADYPYGLIFYGKDWGDVTQDSRTFRNGLTSHNAYLMFITYLGPFLGIGLLILLYSRIYSVFKTLISEIKLKEHSMLICLFFAFVAVSLNALFHNGWLLNANGPTVFLYFAVLHYSRAMINEEARAV